MNNQDGMRNWGITDEVADMLDYVNMAFLTVSYATNNGTFFVNSNDPNADY